MRVFVTGGSGFIGGHIIEGLAPEHEVLALARSEASAAKVAAFGATPVAGDLGAVDPAALAGVDAVVHVAAFAEEWGTREQFWAANVEGTQQLLDAARQAGVSRFVHMSSEAVLFDDQDLIDIDEDHPYPQRWRFLYPETKAEAERRVRAANAPGFTTLCLRPRLVWGPRDTTLLPVLRRMAEQGAFMWVDGGRAATSTTHVANVVAGVKRALVAGKGGAIYHLTDAERSTYREFLSAMTNASGFDLGTRSVPGWLAAAVAATVEGFWTFTGRKGTPPMTRFAVAMTRRSVTLRTDRAAAELGWRPVITVEQGLAGLR